jgi:hypothetical protein
MDRAWFWRGWFLEDAMLDQAVDSVRQPSGERGGRITFVNQERMVMPLSFEVEFADGSSERHDLPVEIWFQADRVSKQLDTVKEIAKVRLDPDGMLPDVLRRNNLWSHDG